MTGASEWMELARAGIALLAVIGLILLCGAIARKTGIAKRMAGVTTGERRLRLAETLYLDARTKMVLVRFDDREHLVLIGQTNAVVVESYERRKST